MFNIIKEGFEEQYKELILGERVLGVEIRDKDIRIKTCRGVLLINKPRDKETFTKDLFSVIKTEPASVLKARHEEQEALDSGVDRSIKDENGAVIVDNEVIDRIMYDRINSPKKRFSVYLGLNNVVENPVLNIDAHSYEDAVLKWAEITRCLDNRLDIKGLEFCKIPLVVSHQSDNYGKNFTLRLTDKLEDILIKGQTERLKGTDIKNYRIYAKSREDGKVLEMYDSACINEEEALVLWACQNGRTISCLDIENTKCMYTVVENVCSPMGSSFSYPSSKSVPCELYVKHIKDKNKSDSDSESGSEKEEKSDK